MDKIYQGKSGTVYMAAETPLASGGEGSIYAIKGAEELVLKVFKTDRRTREREEKLLKMVEYHLDERQLKQVTWPQDVAYDQNGFVGYVMPQLWENRNLNVVYSAQNNKLDLRHRMLIAYNLCAAIDTVHSLNQVCGDLNPQNICVNLNLQSKSALRVTLVDTDSYHITDGDKTYRCEVGLANYLAPEIQNKLVNGHDLRTVSLPTFTKETDLFALAVHIFSLMMNGCHPFACAKQTDNGYEHTMGEMDDKECDSVVLPQPIDNIKNGFFPFHQKKSGVTYPLYAPDFRALPQSVQDLFIRAFVDGYDNPAKRPTAEEWLEVLRKIQSPIEFLQCEKKHYYFGKGITKCPYCEANQRMMRLMSGQGYGIPDTKKEKSDFIYHQKTVDSGYSQQNMQSSIKTNQNTNIRKQKKGKAVYIAAAVTIVVAMLAGISRYEAKIKCANYANEAGIAKENGNYDEAIQQYKNAVDIGLAEENVYIELAECYAAQENFDEAFVTIEKCKERYNTPDDDFLEIYQLLEEKYCKLAKDCVKQGKYDEAIAIIEECKEKYNIPDDDFLEIYQLLEEKYYELARDCVKQEKYDEAIAILDTGMAKLPLSYETLEDYSQAVQYMRENDKRD